MNNLTKLSKSFLFISLSSLALWLGGYIVRQLVIYQFFEPESLSLRTFYNSNNLTAVLITILPILVFNIVTFIIFLISILIFLFISKINLKKEGWFFISLLIIFVTAPFEIYLMFKDYEIINNIFLSNIPSDLIVEKIKERMITLSSFSLIEIFSYLGIIFLFVFKPLRKVDEN
jgi:hypothetical protein